jgi:hypothetical protein
MTSKSLPRNPAGGSKVTSLGGYYHGQTPVPHSWTLPMFQAGKAAYLRAYTNMLALPARYQASPVAPSRLIVKQQA